MSDANFTFKSFKPTLKQPTELGKKIEGTFKTQFNKVGINMKNLKENNGVIALNEKEESLKKKIFNLSKMETLVYSDEYLSNIFNKLKQDAAETYGYHWNETIMNIMFNDYILDDPAYLQKYKNTVAYKKKRRGEEGSNELEKHVQDKLDDVKKDGNQIQINRNKKVSDISKEKDQLEKTKDTAMQTHHDEDVPAQMRKVAEEVDQEMNELFGLGSPKSEIPQYKASALDTYYVKDGVAYGVYSKNLSNDQNAAMAAKFPSPQYQRMPWQVAINNGVKNVPAQVADAPQAQQQSSAVKAYAGNQAMQYNPSNVALYEELPKEIGKSNEAPYDKVMTNGDGFELEFNPETQAQAKKDAAQDATYIHVDETTGAASSGQFTAPLDAENTDKTYQNETTTSASSGQFSGPAIWAKNPENSRFAHKPAWKGGEILQEGVKSGDYLTDPATFKKYANLVEGYVKAEKLLSECAICEMQGEVDEASVKQDALKNLKAYNDLIAQYPHLQNDPDIMNAIQINTERANAPEPQRRQPIKPSVADTGRQFQNPQKQMMASPREEKIAQILQAQPYKNRMDLDKMNDRQLDGILGTIENERVHQMPEEASVDEHHLHSKKDKVDFILQHTYDDASDSAKYSDMELMAMPDNKLHQLYLDTEKSIGMNEIFGLGKPEQSLTNPTPATPNKFASNIMGFKNLMKNALRTEKWGQMISRQMDSYNDMIQGFMDKGMSPEQAAAQLVNLYTGVAESNASMKKGFESLTSLTESEGFNKNFVDSMKTDLEDTRDNKADVSHMSPKELEDKENLFKGGAISEGAKDLTLDGLTLWAAKNVLNSEMEQPFTAIQEFAKQNGMSLEGLKTKAKFFASNAAVFLPKQKAANVITIMKDLIANIDEMNSGDNGEEHDSPEMHQSHEAPHDEYTNPVDEKSVSKAQQRFMGMVHADQKGELENPSPAVAKAAASMSDKDAEDFASTKHKGLPNHVKEHDEEGEFDSPEDDVKQKFVYNPAINAKVKQSPVANAVSKEKQAFIDFLMSNYGVDSLDKLSYKQRQDVISKVMNKKVVMPQPAEKDEIGADISNATVGADDAGVVTEVGSGVSAGNTVPTQPMVNPTQPTSNDPYVELGRALAAANYENPSDEEAKEKAMIFMKNFADRNPDIHKVINIVKQKVSAMKEGMSEKFSSSPTDDHENSFEYYKETFHNGQFGQLKQLLEKIKAEGEVENLALYLDEMGQQELKDWTLKTLGSIEENWHKKDVVNPAEKGKHSGQSVADLRKQLANAKKRGDTSQEREDNFAIRAKTGWGKVGESMIDDQPDSMVNASDTSMAHTMDSPELNTAGVPSDGDGSTSTTPQEEPAITESKKSKNKNMNEDRKTPSMLNLDKVKKETAALTSKDMAQADALKQTKVYPEPKDFYIEQDVDKVQKDAKSGEEIEKEMLAKIQPKDEALHNNGDSTSGNNSIPKRNLTKAEMLELAMNRGKGIHNFVADNKPADKFEERMKKDMGEDMYKLRQDKMKFDSKAPMYNKDTQPIETGEDKEQFDKNKHGFNEAFSGKYTDDFGKVRIVEFQLAEVKEVASVEGGHKLTVDGMGNKYTQKVNESLNFKDITSKYNFYLVEGAVVKTAATAVEDKPLVNESFEKMKHLMNYNSNEFVNTKKSVKF